jgi:hypothetical protein
MAANILASLLAGGAGQLLGGIGTLAKDIRSAITGDISPEKKAEINTKLLELEAASASVQAKVIMAEAGGTGLKSMWRPITMLVFVYIIAHNYIFAPIIQMFYPPMIVLEVPTDLWNLLKIGLGGYIVGRSGEKIIGNWTRK